MAYNYYPQYYQPQQMYQQPQQPVQQQIQNNGLVSVRNEAEARNYPVAPGNSVTFKDETAPYVYTKTMGFSQLDRPMFDKYRLVKETPENPSETPEKSFNAPDHILDTIDGLKAEIETIWGEIGEMKNAVPKKSNTKQRKEDGGND